MDDNRITRRGALKLGSLALVGLSGCLMQPANTTGNPSSDSADSENESGGDLPGTADTCSPSDATNPEGPLTVDFDTREQFRCKGRLLDDFSNLSYWDVLEGSLSGGLSPYPGQSARLSATEDQDRMWIRRRFDDGLDLSDWDLSLAVNPTVSDNRARNFRLQLLAPDRANRIDMWHPLNGAGGWMRLDFGPTEEIGNPDLTDVREIRIQSWVGDDTAADASIDELRITRKRDEGAVIITFDDISRSQYDHAFPILESYGFPGVAGAIPWIVGEEDRMTIEQLQELQSAGWDIVSHPQVARPLPSYIRSQQDALLFESKQWLVDNGFESGARFIIYPYGEASETTLDTAARYHTLGFRGGPNPSGQVTGPMTVGRVNGDNLEETRRMLELAKKHRMICPIMYHTIDGGGNRISAAEFEETMQFIDDLGLPVITASELWEMERNSQ